MELPNTSVYSSPYEVNREAVNQSLPWEKIETKTLLISNIRRRHHDRPPPRQASTKAGHDRPPSRQASTKAGRRFIYKQGFLQKSSRRYYVSFRRTL